MEKLTKRQEEIMIFIQKHHDQYLTTPTYREIRDYLRLKSTNGIQQHLMLLEKKGFIERTPKGIKIRNRLEQSPA